MRLLFAFCLFLLLSACGAAGPAKTAADACAAEVDQRLAGKSFELDASKLVATARKESGSSNIWHLSAPIVFNPGLSTEFTQVLNCKARVDGDTAGVLWLEYIWALKDLKLDDTDS